MKQKLIEAQTRAEELQRQLNNVNARERRSKKTVQSLLDELKLKNMISEELQLKLDLYSGRFFFSYIGTFGGIALWRCYTMFHPNVMY